MSPHKIGISGSTILSNPNHFSTLFDNPRIEHIEIGEFPDQEAFEAFITLYKKNSHSFGLHSPLYRNQSKYDLLEKVLVDPKEAWTHFEKEVALLSEIGASYILVHFPYFKKEKERDANRAIEEGLKKFQAMEKKYGLPIVCEPKLGLDRSAVGIEALDRIPVDLWAKYGIKLCIDIGDYLLATDGQPLEWIKKWQAHIKVVHLHNVEFHRDKYIWVPVHPTHEDDPAYYKVKELLVQLAKSPEVFFVFEHTPHSKPTNAFVDEGIDWVKTFIHPFGK